MHHHPSYVNYQWYAKEEDLDVFVSMATCYICISRACTFQKKVEMWNTSNHYPTYPPPHTFSVIHVGGHTTTMCVGAVVGVCMTVYSPKTVRECVLTAVSSADQADTYVITVSVMELSMCSADHVKLMQ